MLRILSLALLALAPLLGAPARNVFNVLDYGAHPDGSARSTAAFRAAIQAAKAAGGGTVHVPAGTYLTGPIELVSNLVFEIGAGATVRFPADRSELTYGKGRLEGVEGITPDPLIGGRNLENVTITGRGTLATENAAWVKLMNQPEARSSVGAHLARPGIEEARLRRGLQEGHAVPAAVLHPAHGEPQHPD